MYIIDLVFYDFNANIKSDREKLQEVYIYLCVHIYHKRLTNLPGVV